MIPPVAQRRLHAAAGGVDEAPAELRAAVRAAWLAGGSVRAIAAELGKSTRTIQDWLDGFAPAPCGHRGCHISPVEQQAWAAVAAVLDDPDLGRVCDHAEPPGTESPDFRSPRHVVEVKELTSEPVREFAKACDKHLPQRHVPVPGLKHVWAVSADVSVAAASFKGRGGTPRANTMVDPLIGLVKDLEARGIQDVMEADTDTWKRLAKILGFYGDCAVLDTTAWAPGIVFTGALSSHARTLDLEYAVVAFLQQWLDSEQSKKGRDSLAGGTGVHVLALVPSRDGPAAGMLQTLMETHGEIPTTALQLPAEVDELIVVTSDEVLRFARNGGWSRCAAPAVSS